MKNVKEHQLKHTAKNIFLISQQGHSSDSQQSKKNPIRRKWAGVLRCWLMGRRPRDLVGRSWFWEEQPDLGPFRWDDGHLHKHLQACQRERRIAPVCISGRKHGRLALFSTKTFPRGDLDYDLLRLFREKTPLFRRWTGNFIAYLFYSIWNTHITASESHGKLANAW